MSEEHPVTMIPCKKCGKSPRRDYDGYCTDCADELGLTEFSYLKSQHDKKLISDKDFLDKLVELNEREPILVGDEKTKRHADELMKKFAEKFLRNHNMDFEKQSIDSLNESYGVQKADNDKIYTDEVFFMGLNIPENDRLKMYQLVKKYWTIKMQEKADAENLIDKEQAELLKYMWRISFQKSMEEAKPFNIPEDVVPLLLNTEVEDANLPFPQTWIEAKVQIKNRTYYGFHVGSYYSEDGIRYRAILTVYSKYVKHKGEDVKILVPDFIILKKSKDEEAIAGLSEKSNYYHNKIKHFCFSFCNFINEPDVTVQNVPSNPKNNIRRAERGLMTLPEMKNVVIHGKLKIYVDENKKEWQGGTHATPNYRYWVRGFYRHFVDKKRYAKIYALDEHDKKEAGLTWSDKREGVLRRWVKPFIRGKGILIKQSWDVKE